MTNKLGSFIVDIAGQELTPEDRDLLNHPLVGGVIFFARNYESRTQITRLCQQIRRARRNPLFIMVDQEGGRVQRFIYEFTRLPRMGVFGRIYDKNPDQACAMARDCGWLMAEELLAVGIDFSLAPVLDLNNPISTVIGDRAFHAGPQHVVRLATAFVAGMKEAGMPATGKHFPGHGSLALDSHVTTPHDERTLAQLEQADMLPFIGMIKAGLTAIMAAHIIFPQVDKHPVGYSRKWLHTILRERLGFEGIVFSDDLNMAGAKTFGNYADRMLAAREAGCDYVMLCNNRTGAIEVIDNVPHEKHLLGIEKWGLLQATPQTTNATYQSLPRWQSTHKFLLNENLESLC